MLFLSCTADEAERITAMGKNGGSRIAPRRVDAGKYAGSYVIPARVKADPDHADKLDVLRALPEIEIDPDEAWPVTE